MSEYLDESLGLTIEEQRRLIEHQLGCWVMCSEEELAAIIAKAKTNARIWWEYESMWNSVNQTFGAIK